MYLYPYATNVRYLSYKTVRGNADNTATALAMGLTDTVQLGPR